jgi:mRNA interferase HicA
MKRNEFIKYLQKNGCKIIREGSRHSWWMNPEKNLRSAIPRHSEINNILANKICKDLGINRII